MYHNRNMKNNELVYREIMYNVFEKKNNKLTQADLSRMLNISLSIVNKAVKNLDNIGAIKIHQRNFEVLDAKKILFYWASIRSLKKDIVYETRVEMPIREIEKNMSDDIVFTAYTSYKFLFKDVPADYSEVYVYGDINLKERFPKKEGIPNLFVLKRDKLTDKYGKTGTIANTFVDLWNLKEWYAKEFVNAMEARINGILE